MLLERINARDVCTDWLELYRVADLHVVEDRSIGSIGQRFTRGHALFFVWCLVVDVKIVVDCLVVGLKLAGQGIINCDVLPVREGVAVFSVIYIQCPPP